MKNILFWVFLAGTLFSVISNFSSQPEVEEIGYSEFISQVESDQMLSVEFGNDNYTLNTRSVPFVKIL